MPVYCPRNTDLPQHLRLWSGISVTPEPDDEKPTMVWLVEPSFYVHADDIQWSYRYHDNKQNIIDLFAWLTCQDVFDTPLDGKLFWSNKTGHYRLWDLFQLWQTIKSEPPSVLVERIGQAIAEALGNFDTAQSILQRELNDD